MLKHDGLISFSQQQRKAIMRDLYLEYCDTAIKVTEDFLICSGFYEMYNNSKQSDDRQECHRA